MKDLLQSKKFRVAILAVLSAVAIRLGMPETQVEELALILSPFLVYIGGQSYSERDAKAVEASR